LATRLRATLRWIATTTFVLASAGSATAQPASGAATADTGAQVGFERRPQLSLQEELSQSDVVLARIDQGAAAVRRQLEGARAARDVVKTLCLNDKLSQIDVANRSARDRQSALQAAVQRKDTELANHEFTIVTVLRQRVEQLTSEANQCIGEELAFIGQTQVSTTYDPNLPGEDSTAFPPPTPDMGGLGEMPKCSTCSGGP
jgi:hypothetical protein